MLRARGEENKSDAVIVNKSSADGRLSITLKETQPYVHPVLSELQKRAAAVALRRHEGVYDLFPTGTRPITNDMMHVEALDVISKQGYYMVSKASDEKWTFMMKRDL